MNVKHVNTNLVVLLVATRKGAWIYCPAPARSCANSTIRCVPTTSCSSSRR